VRVDLLDDLRERWLCLVRALDVVEEEELCRVRDVDRSIWLVERVLSGGEDREGVAVRAEPRSHGFAGNEIRVRRQTGIEELLD
jgi:hypothetical protein